MISIIFVANAAASAGRRAALVVLIAALLVLGACRRDAAPAEPKAPPTPTAKQSPAPPPPAAPADWCGGHALPESKCTKCNPELIPGFKAAGDWCEEHGYPESACPVCNPQTPPTKAAAARDWCGGHALPESKCTKCNPELIPAFKEAGDWCEEHGYPESACPVCNPQKAPPTTSAAPDWCREHGVPESKCTKCNAALAEGYRAAGDFCEDHGFPESVCPICNPAAPPDAESLYTGIEVRLRSVDAEQAAGLEVAPAGKADVAPTLEVTARITYDRGRLADARPLIPGIVKEVRADVGDQVIAGAPLFVLESAEGGAMRARLHGAKERVSIARKDLERQSALHEDQVVSQRAVDLARQEKAAAESERRALESTLAATGASKGEGFVVVSPLSGTVIARRVLLGARADGEEALATIADTTRMWALLDVPELDAADVRTGLMVTVRVAGVDKPIEGTISWVATAVDPRTRTVTVRAEVDNARGLLRDQQLARARIELAPATGAVVVPRDAIQRLDDAQVVFVRKSPLVYEPRVVHKGHRAGDFVQVSGRLAAGEEVVVAGAFLLRTELLPGSIGAGCCGDD